MTRTGKIMTFSIIVSVYNVSDFLPQCVESVLNQTYKQWNLVLVDDESTDGCATICDDYALRDERIEVVHKSNGGPGSARKAGLDFASGDYTVCLDGDDFLSPDFLEKMNQICESIGADAVLAGAVWYTNDQNHFEVKVPFEGGLYQRSRIEKEIFPCLIENEKGFYFPNNIWSRAWKTELYKKFQQMVDDSIKIGEDAACIKPLIASCDSIYILSDCLYYYRQNQASITKEKKAFPWNGPKLIGQHYQRFLHSADATVEMTDIFMPQIYRNTVHNLFNVAVSAFYQKKSYRDICHEISENIKDPFYENAIKSASFSFFTKDRLALTALKYRWYFLLYIFAMIK